MNNIYLRDIFRGIVTDNPTFRLVLGMCPVLAITTFVINGLGMGVATAAVLICSNVVISSLRRFIPEQVRIPCFIVIIASFVTIIEMLLKAFQPNLYEALGVFIPLIVVNCIILGRAEAFASKQPVLRSLFDGIGIGLGFTIALLIISTLREVIGSGTILAETAAVTQLFGPNFEPMRLFALPPGAFILLGLLLGGMNFIFKRLNVK
ncbi:MAG: electron transport complex subunit E [Firmicutes bacterium]|jgi:electron transport complex protein RnfE|nr:electron transport complex subunit E [Bacillota bacterium]